MPNLLSPEVKVKTLELLRSGTIKQIRGQLKNSNGCRCVLGVIALAGDIPHDENATLDHAGNFLSYTYEGFEDVGLSNSTCFALENLNDTRRLTFPELADHIEATL